LSINVREKIRKNQWVSVKISQKTKYHETTDILRIPEKYQKYRYAKISQLLETGQFCRYVGSISNFERVLLLPINSHLWFLLRHYI
jgi:hypothetical protein